MKSVTLPLLVAATLLLIQPAWSQTPGGAVPAPGGGITGGGVTGGGIGGTDTFGGVTGAPTGQLGGTTITGDGTTTGDTSFGNAGDTSAAGIGLPPVVSPPVENLVPGSEGNIVFPPAENLVPGSRSQIVMPPVESLIPGAGVGAAGRTPGATNNLGTGLGTGTTNNLGTDLGGTTNNLGTGFGTSGIFLPQSGLGTGGGETAPAGVPGQLRGGQGGYRGDGYTGGAAGETPAGGGTGINTLSPGSRPGSPEAITAPIEPYDADEPDSLDFSISG